MSFSLVLPFLIHFGAGERSKLPEVCDALDVRRVLLVHGPYTDAAGLVAPIRDALGDRVAATFGDSRAPTDNETRAEVAAAARETDADAVVAVGGGSAIDAGKCAVFELGSRVPLITVPTTFSGAENTLDCGVVDRAAKTKNILRGPHLVAKASVYDPDLLHTMAVEVVAGSAMNALAHCVEALYTPASNRFIQSIAIGGAQQLVTGLKRRFVEGDVDGSWGLLLEGSIAAGIACGNASIALHHVMCHYVGPSLSIPHGTANAIMLPHAMRFNLPAAEPLFAELASALGRSDGAAGAVAEIAELHTRLGLPYRLGPLGLNETIVNGIADHVIHHARLANNPRPVSRSDIEAILWGAA